MKATSFVVVLSLSVLSFPALALEKNLPSVAPASLSKTIIKKINLNTADVALLTHSFKGIGKKRAESIVSFREVNGPFKSIQGLAKVRGLGASFVSHQLTQLQDVFSVE
jgi:competence protein ComEA